MPAFGFFCALFFILVCMKRYEKQPVFHVNSLPHHSTFLSSSVRICAEKSDKTASPCPDWARPLSSTFCCQMQAVDH